MFSPAQASVSLRPLPPIPMQAMFNLLFRFWPRKSVGTPNASALAASEVVLIKSRRLTGEDEKDSGDFLRVNFFDRFHMNTRIQQPGWAEARQAQRRARRLRQRPQRAGTGD